MPFRLILSGLTGDADKKIADTIFTYSEISLFYFWFPGKLSENDFRAVFR